MFDDNLTKTILEDLEWERNNAVESGCSPDSAFTTTLIHAAADMIAGKWNGAEHKHFIAALWDLLNAEMARIEATEENEIKAPTPSQGYYFTELGIFEGRQYALTYQYDKHRYIVKVGGVESEITYEAVEDYPYSCYEHRLIRQHWNIKRSADSIDLNEANLELAVIELSKKGRLHNGVWMLNEQIEEITSKAFGAPNEDLFPPKPEESATTPVETVKTEEVLSPNKTAENDDFLKPSTLTKNILRDWGQL